jgi:enolase-phosphatase E1
VRGEPSALLLDIEGTTTPLDFVARVLFPFARARMGDYLARHLEEPETKDDVRGLRAEHGRDRAAGRTPPAWADTPEATAAYAEWLMDEDRKATALKTLQGRIWEEGFRSGELQGMVYDDVPRAFARWRRDGRRVAIFSSGSVLAQKLLFGHSNAGDLTAFLSGYYDTTTGPKRDALSYRKIAAELVQDGDAGLFVSDVAEELDAARAAGWGTALCVREGPLPDTDHRAFRSFDELL